MTRHPDCRDRRAALLPSALLLSMLLPPHAARAEVQVLPPDAPGAAEIKAYARTPAYRTLLTQAMARVPAAVVARCPKLVVEDGVIIVQQKMEFGPNKAPVGGAWRHSQPVRGCGADTLVNFHFFPTAEGRVMTIVAVPGTTRTDVNQQRDAHTFALVALAGPSHNCAGFETVNTVFGGFGTRTPEVPDPGPAADYRPWWETWTMLGCGKRYVVPMNFTPNRLGTAILQPGGIEIR